MLGVDAVGLEPLDRRYLALVIEHFAGGPVGIQNLSVSLGEEIDTLEDVVEPFLIQSGLLMRTPRGREATARAYRHLGLAEPHGTHTAAGTGDPARGVQGELL